MERLQRAKALTVIGEVRVSKRELDSAIEPLEAANALLQGDPPKPGMLADWRKAQGQAAFWLGHVAYTQRRFGPAEQYLSRYREVSKKWLAAEPANQDAQVELAYADNNLGVLMLDQGQLVEARERFARAAAAMEAVLQRRTDDASLRSEWAGALSWLGSTLANQGLYAQAEQVFRHTLDHAQTLLARNPGDQAWQEDLGISARSLADVLLRDGRPSEARPFAAQAVQAFRMLTQLDPMNRSWAFSLIRSEVTALRSQALPRPEVTDGLLRRLKTLEAGRPPSARWHPLRAELAGLHARALRRSGEHAQALASVEPQLDLMRADRVKMPNDLETATALLELTLIQATELTDDANQRRRRCEVLRDGLRASQVQRLLRVHAGLTRVAAGAHQCLQQPAEAHALRQWLEMQSQLLPVPLDP